MIYAHIHIWHALHIMYIYIHMHYRYIWYIKRSSHPHLIGPACDWATSPRSETSSGSQVLDDSAPEVDCFSALVVSTAWEKLWRMKDAEKTWENGGKMAKTEETENRDLTWVKTRIWGRSTRQDHSLADPGPLMLAGWSGNDSSHHSFQSISSTLENSAAQPHEKTLRR